MLLGTGTLMENMFWLLLLWLLSLWFFKIQAGHFADKFLFRRLAVNYLYSWNDQISLV